MSSKQSRRMRAYAREHLDKIDEAFEEQRPRWFAVARKILPMWDLERLLARPLARWKARMEPKNEAYRKHSEKVLARTGWKIKRAYEAGGLKA